MPDINLGPNPFENALYLWGKITVGEFKIILNLVRDATTNELYEFVCLF